MRGTVGRLIVSASLSIVASACASSTVRVGDSSGGAGAGAASGSVGGSSGSSASGGSGISLTLPPPSDGSVTSSNDGEAACTNGDACVCSTLQVAVVGKPGVWGDSSDTAFQDWLSSNSAGTAKVDNYLSKPTFTPAFLAGYNLVILAGLGDDSNNGPWWTFSASEVAAFQDWIENQGGGVISLSGYSNDGNEINAKNALLAFSGIAYGQSINSPPCAIAKCPYQCNNPYQITEFNRTDPVIENLSLGVQMIGIDGGRPISAPADAHVAATTTDASSVRNWLVGKITGKGRVLVYADEWITYTNQWAGTNQNNDPSCKGSSPQDLYQTAQFWYNMIHWTQPGATCFTIVDTTIW